jgi:2-C-methyl-D-erythritol 4-phosphate cytidylyltransferase
MKFYTVIVAGGSGRRMGTDVPKQFLEIAGKPVLLHTIERFYTFDNSVKIITVLPEDQISYWEYLREKYTRFLSVKNGLELVEIPGVVAIHDGVRPLVSIDTIRRCFETAGSYGNAIPVISPSDTLRMVDDKGNRPVDRLQVKQIQTPQVFDAGLIKKAYLQEYQPEFTDDATVLEKTGEKIYLVEGNRENIKITNPEDLIIVKNLLPLMD